jgi:hypothetical protein
MNNEKTIILKIFDKLTQDDMKYNFGLDFDKEGKKEQEQLFKEVVKDFPLLLKVEGTTGVTIKRSEINTGFDELTKKLDLYYTHKTYYTDKPRNAQSQTKYPFKASKGVENCISSNILSKEQKIDFVGNAAYSQYYKLLLKLISNDGKYLDSKYDINDLPKDVQTRIKQIEEWFKSKQQEKEQDGFLDDYTAQILFPYGDSYISISPAENMSLLKEIISLTSKISKDNFEKKKEIISQKKKLESQILKIQIKKARKTADITLSFDEKKVKELNISKQIANLIKKNLSNEDINIYIENVEKIKVLDEQLKSMPYIQTTKWQQMISKPQNISLNAPSFKAGFLLAQAPNFDLEKIEEYFSKQNLSLYMPKTLQYLYTSRGV